MSGFFLALRFLTRLPLPAPREWPTDAMARASAWFPAVGLVVGALLVGIGWLLADVDAWLAALLTLIAWVWITGALHLDGLADLFDALGAAHRDRARFLQVLAEPHLGSYGAIALMLQLAAKLVLLALAYDAEVPLFALLLVPAWTRLGALWWGRVLPPLKPGLGESCARPGYVAPMVWLATLALASWPFLGLWCAPLVLLAWLLFLRRKVGGMNGDCLGAGIEWSESMLLLALVLVELL